MSLNGGGSGQQGGQAIVQTGPSLQAANMAAQAQIGAAQQASQIASQNTNAALQALMGEYGTALTYANPMVNTGNQAAAQLNYMLGMPAVSPGAAPTAPTMPTLATAQGDITNSAINNYIMQNSGVVGGGNGGQGFGHLSYTGAGSDDPTLLASIQSGWAHTPKGETNPGGLTIAANTNQIVNPLQEFVKNTTIHNT